MIEKLPLEACGQITCVFGTRAGLASYTSFKGKVRGGATFLKLLRETSLRFATSQSCRLSNNYKTHFPFFLLDVKFSNFPEIRSKTATQVHLDRVQRQILEFVFPSSSIHDCQFKYTIEQGSNVQICFQNNK